MGVVAIPASEKSRIAHINRAYVSTVLNLHSQGQHSYLLARFDLSEEMLDELAGLSENALDSLILDMNTTLFGLELDASLMGLLLEDNSAHALQWMQVQVTGVAQGDAFVALVLQELAVSNIHSDSTAYRFNCSQALADQLSLINPLKLSALAAHSKTLLRARFTRNHLMAAEVNTSLPIGLLMSLR
jgi:hypothetical protein